jgi:uncharacterized membrane protein
MLYITFFYILVGIIIGTAGMYSVHQDGIAEKGKSLPIKILGYAIAFIIVVVTWPLWVGIYLSRFV